MPMDITFTIEDDVLASIQAYMDTQRQTVAHPVTGRGVSEPIWKTVEDFMAHQIGSLLKSVVEQIPTPAMAERIAEIQRMHAEMEIAARPQVRVTQAQPRQP